jgi:hypothetical protein
MLLASFTKLCPCPAGNAVSTPLKMPWIHRSSQLCCAMVDRASPVLLGSASSLTGHAQA